MSTAARKARKRSGIPLVKEPKVGTPFRLRTSFLRHKLAHRMKAVARRDGAEAAEQYMARMRGNK